MSLLVLLFIGMLLLERYDVRLWWMCGVHYYYVLLCSFYLLTITDLLLIFTGMILLERYEFRLWCMCGVDYYYLWLYLFYLMSITDLLLIHITHYPVCVLECVIG